MKYSKKEIRDTLNIVFIVIVLLSLFFGMYLDYREAEALKVLKTEKLMLEIISIKQDIRFMEKNIDQ